MNYWWLKLGIGILVFPLLVVCGCGDDDDDDQRDADDDQTDDDAMDDDQTDDDTGDDDAGDDHTGDDDTGDDDTTVCEGCLIDTVCYTDGDVNLLNECLHCDVAHSTTEWSFNDGASCDDELFCNGGDQCLYGACDYHAGDPCGEDGLWCNGTESCDEEEDQCVSEYNDDDPRCPDDELFCTGDESCDEEINQCVHSGDPCNFDEVCVEDGDGCVPACFRDADFDGFGDLAVMIPLDETCPAGWVDNHDDCDDADAISFPDAPELPDDGIDQNCDGEDFLMSDETGIFVAPTGDDENPGTMAEPLATLHEAQQVAYEQGKAVFVAAGTYTNTIIGRASFFGGYEPVNWTRDIAANETTVACSSYTAVIVNYDVPPVAVQGFTLANINPMANLTSGVYVNSGKSATIVDNIIQPTNTAAANMVTGAMIYGQARFIDNVIEGGYADELAFGVQLYADAAFAYLEGNTIVAGDSGLYSRGIDCVYGGVAVARNNEIFAGTASDMSMGVMTWPDSSATLVNNFIYGGSSPFANGVYGHGGNVTVMNNVIDGGDADRAYGVNFYDQGHGLIVNNIIAGGSGTVFSIGVRASEGRVMLYNNDIYGDTTTYLVNNSNSLDNINSCSFTGCTEAGGNISEDPQFDVDGLHLTGESPCLDVGVDPLAWYGGFGALWDIDGDARPQGDGWDIGLDEVVP
ncbi:MAG TPA: right-handed parallel beta-helix repeat-containing protein [bacterium]|nr:right-handed parallel beta-helix repeat-containing protein [bacterium]